MEQFFVVAKIIAPIVAAIGLGILARKKNMMTPEEIHGLQQFVIQFALPCVVFNACLSANIGAESLGSMALVLILILASTLGGFYARKKLFPYHNLPLLFSTQETGLLGIPLFMVLFGADQVYHMGVLDLTQAVFFYITVAILSSSTGENPSPVDIFKKVITSPLLIVCALALALNFSGIGAWMMDIGIGGVLTECTGFFAQTVSVLMIFCVGYNFSLSKNNRSAIFKVSAVHFILFACAGLLIQLGLFLLPNVGAATRWAVLMYTTLPPSYIAPSLGKTEEDFAVSSGVCSVLTVASLLVFCIIAVFAI